MDLLLDLLEHVPGVGGLGGVNKRLLDAEGVVTEPVPHSELAEELLVLHCGGVQELVRSAQGRLVLHMFHRESMMAASSTRRIVAAKEGSMVMAAWQHGEHVEPHADGAGGGDKP